MTLCLLNIIKSAIATSTPPAWFVNFIAKINNPECFDLPISELYKLAPYSQPKLSETFKKYLGTTLTNYMSNIKIEYACSLLLQNNLTILQISELAGFMSLSCFNHVFKKVKKISPSEFKRQHTFDKNNLKP